MIPLKPLNLWGDGNDENLKRTSFLNGNEINTEFDFHKKIGNIFKAEEFISGYGYNLDALWEIATSGAGLNLELHWQGAEESRRKCRYRRRFQRRWR